MAATTKSIAGHDRHHDGDRAALVLLLADPGVTVSSRSATPVRRSGSVAVGAPSAAAGGAVVFSIDIWVLEKIQPLSGIGSRPGVSVCTSAQTVERLRLRPRRQR